MWRRVSFLSREDKERTPGCNVTTVFGSEICKGINSIGGHSDPISIVGGFS